MALECEQYKKPKASMEAAPFQSVPKRTAVEAVPAPLPPKGTRLQQQATWLGKPSDPPPEVEERSESHLPQYKGSRTASSMLILSWNPRELVIIRGTEDYLEVSEEILVEVKELETLFVRPDRCDGKNACYGGGYRKLSFIKRNEGNLLADAWQCAALRENQARDHKELQEVIKCMNAKQSRLLADAQRKQKIEDWSP